MIDNQDIEDATFEEVVQSNNEVITTDISEDKRAKFKNKRQHHWRTLLENDLQILLKEAATIQHTLTSSKTEVKKRFYQKKFSKINNNIQRYINALEQLDLSSSKGIDNVITTDLITE